MASAPEPGRRRLLHVLGKSAAACGVLALPSALREEVVPSALGAEVRRYYPRRSLGPAHEVSGPARAFSYPDADSPCFLVRLEGTPEAPRGEVVAYSALCPHLGCRIDAQVDPKERMVGPCPCHFSCFDLSQDGLQLQGQATESLPRVLLEEDGGELFAVGLRGLLYGRFGNVE